MKWQATAPHDDGFERYSCTLAAGHGNPGCLFQRWHHLGSPCRCVPPLVQGHDQMGPLGRQRQLPEQFAAELLNKVGPPGMNVGRFQGSGPRSCGRTWLMGPRVTMIRARAAPAEWNPYARLMIRRTRLFRPSCLALLMPSRTAASIPARRLRMVAARVTNGFRPLRWALEQNRSSRNATSVSSRSESNTARSASLRV